MSVDARRLAADQEDRRGPDYGKPHDPVQTCPHCSASLRAPDGPTAKAPRKDSLVWVDPPFDPASPANYTVGREGYVVHGAIIHTMVGSTASAVGAFKNAARQASAHMCMSMDGSELQMVDTDNGAWHCGRYYPDASHPLANMTTVGMEHEDGGQYNSPRPDPLYATSAKRLAMIATVHNFPLDVNHVQPHRNVSVLPTACCDSLDWQRILAGAIMINNPVNPPPPPPLTPEWQTNLKPVPVQTFTLIKAVTVLDLVTGTVRGTVAPGALAIGFETTVAGVPYWVTTFGSTHGDGIKKADVAGAIAPPPPPAGWKVSQTSKPFTATFPAYVDGAVQTERFGAAQTISVLPKGGSVTVSGYSYADPPVQAQDAGNGQPGPDFLWWTTAGGFVSDAVLDTSGTPGLPPAGAFDPMAPPVPVYAALAPDMTVIATGTDLNALVVKVNTWQQANRGLAVTLNKDGAFYQTIPAVPPDPIPVPVVDDPVTAFFKALYAWLKGFFKSVP